jgi:glycolate oxidase iron-sulfur subunit
MPSSLDIHELLAARLGDFRLRPGKKTITWHDPCHLNRGQGLSKKIRDFLNMIPEITYVEMKNADRCCGFGGVMRMTHPRLSDGIAGEKIRNIIATQAALLSPAARVAACRSSTGSGVRDRTSKFYIPCR